MNHRKYCFLVWCWILGAGAGLAADSGGGGSLAQSSAPAPTNSAAPAALAAGKTADAGIRFQFDGLPYADVITRFAQMVNKPLIADLKIDGTLTFSDPRPYTYPEALDTLNLILSLKGVMLVESDRYLRLVPFKELPQLPLRIFHGLEHTGDAQPGEVVTVVLPLQYLDASELAQPASAMLSNAGSIAPLSRGRGLIVTDRLSNIKRIRDLLNEVDTASPVQRQMKSYNLLHASGAVVVDLINRTFGSASAPRRVEFNQVTKQYQQLPPDPNDYVTAVFDEGSRTMVMFGPADRMALAEGLIKQFEEKNGAPGEVKTFYPQSLSALELARMIRQALPSVAEESEPRAVAAMKTRLVVDPTPNRLIVAASTAGQLTEIEQLIKTLDVGAAQGTNAAAQPNVPNVRFYRCRVVDPDSMVRILTDAMARPGYRPPSERPFKVTLDPSTRSIILTGTTEDVEQALVIARQLDSALPAQRLLRFASLKSSRASEIITRIRPLYQDQAKNLTGPPGPEVLMVPDELNNRLILAGTAAELKLLTDLIAQLDVAPDDSDRQLKSVPLKYTSANWLATLLQQLHGRLFRTEDPHLRVVLTPSTDDRTLVLQAPPALITRLEETIKALDVEPARGVFEVRTYQLTGANATEMVATLGRLFADRQDWQKRPTGIPVTQPRFEADSASNCLIVAATREQLEQIDLLIKELRASVEVATEVRTFHLKYCDPAQMVTLLDTMLHEQAPVIQGRFRASPYGASVADYGKLRIAAAPVLDAVIIQGPPDKLRLAEQLITDLDVAPDDSDRQLKSVPLKYASANWLATLLQQLHGRLFRTGDPHLRVVLTPSTDDRTLVLQASPALITRLEETIKALDVEPARGVFEVRTYQLTGANATEMVATLGRLFADRQDWQKRPTGIPVTQPRFEADSASNCLIVAATREQLEQIDLLIKELRASVEVATEVRTFRLKYCDPAQMVTLLDTMLHEQAPVIQGRFRASPYGASVADYGKLRIAAAPVLDAVVIQGPPDKLRLAEQLITDLDKEKTDSASAIRTVHLAKARAEAVAEAVNKTLDSRGTRSGTRRTIITPVAASNSLLLSGPPDEVEEMLKIIHDLDQDSTNGNIEFHIYRLENGNAKEVYRILSQMIDTLARSDPRFGRANQEAPVTMAIDDRSNSLIVSASSAAFKLVERLLAALDQAPRRMERVMNVYTLVNAEPFELASKLQMLYADRPKEEQISAEGDYFSNTMTVVARPQDFPQIEEQIRRLDQAAVDNSLQVRMVAIERMPAAQMAAMLTNIYSQMSAGDVRIVERLPPRPKETNTMQVIPISTLSTNSADHSTPTLTKPSTITNALSKTNTLDDAHSPTQTNFSAQANLFPQTNRSETAILAPTNQPPHPFFPEVVVAVDKAANALLLSGPAKELDHIQTIIRDLTRAAASNNTELRIFPLQEADPIVVARTLDELFRPDGSAGQGGGFNAYRGRRANQGQGGPIPTARVIVVAEPRSRSIIVRAQPTDLTLVESLIKQLDVAGTNAQLNFRLVALENSQAEKLLPLVTQMIAELRVSRPGEPVMVTRDPRGNALFVVARNTLLDQIEAMIQKLDTPADYAEAEVEIIPLKNGNAAQLATVLQELLRPGIQGEITPAARELQEQVRRLKVRNGQDEPIELDLTKPIKIMSDPVLGAQGGGNRLILISTPDNLHAMSAVVAMMDTVPSMANIRIFPLQYADAASVQRLIAELYQGPNAVRLPPEDRPNVAIDTRTDSLIVSGNEASFSVVTNLLSQLDREGEAFTGRNAQLNFRLVALENSQAEKLLPLVTQMIAELRVSRPGEPIMVTRGPRGNVLFVVARNTLLDQIEAMIQKLDTPADYAEAEVEILPLKNGNAAQLASVLQALLRPGIQGEISPAARELQEQVRRLKVRNGQDEPIELDLTKPIKIMSDPLVGAQGGGNRLILVSTPDNLRAMSSVVAMMDTVPSMANIRIFPLQYADAASVQRLIADLYQGPNAARLPPEDRPNVAIDTRTDALIVSGNETAFSVVTNLLSQLDREGEAFTGQIRLLVLKHARASQLASVLEQFFRSKRSAEATLGTGMRSARVTVTPDDRSNTLLITGSRESFAAIERMVAQLDAEQVATRTNFKAITLKHATASKLQATLNQLFARRPAVIRGEAPEPITIVEDSWANALVVGAAPEDMQMVESLIAQLDSESTETGIEVQVLPLVKADARQVAQTITTLYRTGGPGTPSAVTANVDERLNAVVVSAGQNDIKRIIELVKKLDTDQVTQVHQIRIFTLINARAVQLAAILTSVLNVKPTALTDQSPSRQALIEFISRSPDGKELITSALKEGILISPDPRVNALVVSAPVEYMKFLERLIADLDALSPQVATIKVFALKNADARQMMTVLTTLFRLQVSAQSSANPRTIQYNLMRPTPVEGQLAPELGVGGEGVVGSAEESALTVTVDLRSNSLLVGGTERYVNLAEEIIQTLDSSPAQERKAEVYRLKNSRATEIQSALQNFLRQDTQLLVAAVGQQAMAQEMLDREATIVAETNSNTLLISATPRFFTQVRDLVEKLDQPLRQVLIQVMLAEVTLSKDDELGVEWTYSSGGNPASKTGTDFGVAKALKDSGGFGSAISGNNFSFLFRALQSENRLRVLSRPQILTADNQLATIKVGQQVPLVTSSQTIALNGNNVNTYNYQDVGVTLTVTPRISPDGFVKMDVSPQITQLSTSTTEINAGVKVPNINQRLATTSVSVQSGQSIMIGGLISTVDDFSSQKFPFLGNIPLLGFLFRSNVRNTVRTELLIVLTPQVLINGAAIATTNTAVDVTREQLDRATFRQDSKNDPLERQILEPLYPDLKTNNPAALSPKKKSAPKQQQP